MKNKIALAKNAVSFVVGAGVTKIVHAIIANNVQPTKPVDQVTVTAASIVLGSLVADKTKDYTDAKIDEIVEWWNVNVKKNV